MSWLQHLGPVAAGAGLVLGFGLIFLSQKAGEKAEQASGPNPWASPPQWVQTTTQLPPEPSYEDRELRDRIGRLEADVARLKDDAWRLGQSMRDL